MTMRSGFPALAAVAVALAVCSSPAEAAEARVALAGPTDLPHAGLRISLPAGQKPGIPSSATTVLVAQAGHGDRWQSKTTIEATRARSGASAPKPRALAEALMPRLQRAGGYEKSTFVASDPVQVEAQPGWQVARTFSKAGKTVVVVVIVWTGPFPRHDVSLHYVVYFQWNGAEAAKATRIARAMCRSIRHVPLLSPSETDLPPLTGPLAYPRARLAIGIPFGWHLLPAPRRAGKAKGVMRAAVTDYVYGVGAPEMSVQVERGVTKVPDFDKLDEDALEAYLSDLRRRKARRTGWRHLRHRRVWMIRRVGVEMIGVRRIGRQPFLEVMRQVFHEGDLYTLTLRWRGGDVRRATAAMLRLSLSLRLLASPSGPQTQPAPAPEE